MLFAMEILVTCLYKKCGGDYSDVGGSGARCRGATNEIRVIGTRHGEKLFETLLTREELAGTCGRFGAYYRVPADNRDLNYAKYFSEGEKGVSSMDDYNSHNTHQLNVDEMSDMLRKLKLHLLKCDSVEQQEYPFPGV